MGFRHSSKKIFVIGFLAVANGIILASCNSPTLAPTASQTQPTQPAATPTIMEPTPTSIPMAVQVNGEGISLEDFNGELARYQAAQGETSTLSAEEQQSLVADSLIDEILLAQAAYQEGFTLGDADLDARLQSLAESAGGQDALAAWQAGQGYSEAQLRSAIARAAAAAWKRDQITETVPAQAEQVHVRQIVVYNQADADAALQRLNSGDDFDTLAKLYDPVTGGDLGWFPKGYLTTPEVEEVAFSLQPGDISGIIQSSVGYHIIELIERESSRDINPDAQLILEKAAIEDWLAAARSQADVLINLP